MDIRLASSTKHQNFPFHLSDQVPDNVYLFFTVVSKEIFLTVLIYCQTGNENERTSSIIRGYCLVITLNSQK